MTKTFNPEIEVGKLRDHLVPGDKLISFLLGAGASGAVTANDGKPLIPLVAGLTDACQKAVEAMGQKYAHAWTSIVSELSQKWTIEDVLTLVRQMSAAMLAGDSLAGLTKVEIVTFEEKIRATISDLVQPDGERLPAQLPHQSLARWIHRIDRLHAIEKFTTNYDTLIERALEKERVPTFDGFAGAFEPFFYPASLRFDSAAPASNWTRLWKIHGSVTWTARKRESDGHVQIVRGRESTTGEMILPSVLKYDESRKQPYVAMLDRLRDTLDRREDGVLVSIGYSFADQHINEIVFEALRHNPRLHLFALTYGDIAESSDLAREAQSLSNILVFGRSSAIVAGTRGVWRPRDVDEPASQMAGAFVIDSPDDGDEADWDSGQLRLGDFAIFCQFLDQIVTAS